MLISSLSREEIFRTLRSTLLSNNVTDLRVLELGVHRGDNAKTLLDELDPSLLVLVDAWSAQELAAGYYSGPPEKAIADLSQYSGYFNGDVRSQATFDQNLNYVANRFSRNPCVQIIRSGTSSAFKVLLQRSMSFDLIYIDACHQYEYVLSDLIAFSALLSPLGVFCLNDCLHTKEGALQNLGVLPAVVEFLNRYSVFYEPLLLSSCSELVIGPANRSFYSALESKLASINRDVFGVPANLLASAKVENKILCLGR